MAITQKDRRGPRDLWRKVFKEVAAQYANALEARIANGQGDQPTNPAAVLVSQNMLRICLEEAIGESSRGLLQDTADAERFLGELGLRLAAYCISAAPLEAQAGIVDAMVEALPRTVSDMRAKGFVIRCEWKFGGEWRPNLPAGRMQ